jgi:hypothetical protein
MFALPLYRAVKPGLTINGDRVVACSRISCVDLEVSYRYFRHTAALLPSPSISFDRATKSSRTSGATIARAMLIIDNHLRNIFIESEAEIPRGLLRDARTILNQRVKRRRQSQTSPLDTRRPLSPETSKWSSGLWSILSRATAMLYPSLNDTPIRHT